MDSSQGGFSVPSAIQGQNSTPSSSLNNSHVAGITQPVAGTLCTTLRRSINTPTAMPGTCSRSTLPPGGTFQLGSTRHIVSSPASGIASTPTPLSCHKHLPIPITNPEARVIITSSTANASYRQEQDPEAVAIATAGDVYTSINSLRQSQHPLIWSL
jgi:hypothetical protein